MNSPFPWSRVESTQPQRITVCSTSSDRNSPQVCVRYNCQISVMSGRKCRYKCGGRFATQWVHPREDSVAGESFLTPMSHLAFADARFCRPRSRILDRVAPIAKISLKLPRQRSFVWINGGSCGPCALTLSSEENRSCVRKGYSGPLCATSSHVEPED